MNATATPPLASIIVRTMGRPVLTRALASIAAQTHRPLEIVLVDAAGSGLAMDRYADLAVRTAGRGRRLHRGAAANAGLEAASGEWMGFLDEDDEMEPGHVTLLLATAVADQAPVAYGQTRMVDAAGRTTRIFGGGPFDRAALLRSNYLSVGCALFHRLLIDAGARFDESFETFEDWDFWLLLSSRAPFAFSGRATAVYHAQEGLSGMGAAGNLDREAALAQRERLMRKWQAAPA